MPEGLAKLISFIAGAAVAWPCVSVLLDAPPAFDGAENWGSTLGVLLGASLHAAKGLFSPVMKWRMPAKAVLVLILVAVWLGLLTYFKQRFDVLFGDGPLGPEGKSAIEQAETALSAVAFLIGLPLSIAFAAGAEKIEAEWAKRKARKDKQREEQSKAAKKTGLPSKDEGKAAPPEEPKA